MTEQNEQRTVEQICAQTLVRHAPNIAGRLRDAADRIERHAQDVNRVGQPGYTSYASVASSCQNEMRALLGNLMLEVLTTDAFDADAARLRRRAAEAIAEQIDARCNEAMATVGTDPIGRTTAATISIGARIAREYAAKEG